MTENLYIYRASELGNCEKALIAARIGYTPMQSVFGEETSIGRIMKEGNLHEADVVEQLNSSGREVILQQHEVNLIIMPGVLLQGHLDGVLDNGPNNRQVLEIKSMGDTTFKGFKKHGMDLPGIVQKYKWQFSAYMHLMESPMLLICKNRNNGEIIETVIKEPFYSISDIREKIVRVEEQAALGELPVTCSVKMYPCPFVYLHEGDETEFIVDEAIDSYVKVFQDARDLEEKYKKSKEQARAKLREMMQSRSQKKIETRTHKVTLYEIKGRTKIDYEQLVEDHGIDIAPYKVIGNPSEGLRITNKEDDKDGEAQQKLY